MDMPPLPPLADLEPRYREKCINRAQRTLLLMMTHNTPHDGRSDARGQAVRVYLVTYSLGSSPALLLRSSHTKEFSLDTTPGSNHRSFAVLTSS